METDLEFRYHTCAGKVIQDNLLTSLLIVVFRVAFRRAKVASKALVTLGRCIHGWIAIFFLERHIDGTITITMRRPCTI